MPGVEFETGSLTIAVMQSDAFGLEFKPHTHPIAFHVDDFEAAREELRSRGVEFEGEPLDSGVCLQAFFSDPDGNALAIHHRYADGGSAWRGRLTSRACCASLRRRSLGALMRRYDDFQAAEDAVQEALVAAASQWAERGVPENPRGWLIQVASRRMVDQLRSEGARRRREELAATLEPEGVEAVDADDTLLLLFLCCHPALSSTSAIALTLRAVGGLTTREIAAAFLVPEATMAQRISRAKRSIEEAGGRFQPPARRRLARSGSTPCSRSST